MAALRHREQNIITYGIDLPMIDPWTSTSSIIDGILALLDTTTRIVDSPAAANKVAKDSDSQLPDLAEVLFACISQRLERLAMLVVQLSTLYLLLNLLQRCRNWSFRSRERASWPPEKVWHAQTRSFGNSAYACASRVFSLLIVLPLQEEVDMPKLPFRWRRSTKISALLLLFATGKPSIHLKKIPISIASKVILNGLKSNLPPHYTNGIFSMVSNLPSTCFSACI